MLTDCASENKLNENNITASPIPQVAMNFHACVSGLVLGSEFINEFEVGTMVKLLRLDGATMDRGIVNTPNEDWLFAEDSPVENGNLQPVGPAAETATCVEMVGCNIGKNVPRFAWEVNWMALFMGSLWMFDFDIKSPAADGYPVSGIAFWEPFLTKVVGEFTPLEFIIKVPAGIIPP